MEVVIKCEYCQAWPDCYTCSNPETFVKNEKGELIGPRECLYAYITDWDERWLAHPCPFFEGTIEKKA